MSVLRVLNGATAMIARARQVIKALCLVLLAFCFENMMPRVAKLVDGGDLIFKGNPLVALDRELRLGVEPADVS